MRELSAKRFILHAPTPCGDDFDRVVEVAERLKPHGNVLVNLSALADKCFYAVPDFRSPWHDYASRNPTVMRFFPHERIAPHIPADLVERNRELLLKKAEKIRAAGLGAAFWSVEPHYLPESFFRENPELRGSRVDHPRRSNREEFSLCVDLPEVQQMYTDMVAELVRNVPELQAFIFKTNDAGGSLCWATALYAGPQGPAHCRHRRTGHRVRDFVGALHRGAAEGGGACSVYIGHCNFWGGELYDIESNLPPDTYLAATDPGYVRVGSMLGSEFPVKGMFNALDVLRSAERAPVPEVHTVFVDFRACYDRCRESDSTMHAVIDVLNSALAEPTSGALLDRYNRLNALCTDWVGKDNAPRLLEALDTMDRALTLKHSVAHIPPFVSICQRLLTRPLLALPERLTPEEEACFLPYVFATDDATARNDYTHYAGRPYNRPDEWFTKAVAQVRATAEVFEDVAPDRDHWTFALGTSLRVWASLMRSAYNFYHAQRIRNENRERFEVEDYTPPPIPTSTGDPGVIEWHQLQRDEMDNAQELLDLLAERGLSQIHHVTDDKYTDTFCQGPHLLEELRKKIELMRRHWRDIEAFMATPYK